MLSLAMSMFGTPGVLFAEDEWLLLDNLDLTDRGVPRVKSSLFELDPYY
jgi:hypothetical protein